MSTGSEVRPPRTPAFPPGQRLYCERCGSEIEVVGASAADPPNQVFRCCGQDMRPLTGAPMDAGTIGPRGRRPPRGRPRFPPGG